MEDFSREKNVLENGKLLEREFSFSVKYILPTFLYLLAFVLMYLDSSTCPKVLLYSTFFLFVSSCLWDLKGFFISSILTVSLLLAVQVNVFSILPFCFFLLSIINTSFILASLKKMWIISEKSKEEELYRLKIWESHYYAFRLQCLTELEEVKDTQKNLSFIEQELESLEKERLEESLEEDSFQKALLDLLSTSQQKCISLQSEIELLEEILLKASKPIQKKRVSKKEKVNVEDGQSTFL